MKRALRSAVAFTLSLMFRSAAHACAACYGDPASTAVQGMNMGILFMVGVTGTVLAGFVAAFIVYSKRAAVIAHAGIALAGSGADGSDNAATQSGGSSREQNL